MSDGIFSVSQEEFGNVCVCTSSSRGKAETVNVISLWKFPLHNSEEELLRVFLTEVSSSSGEEAFVLPQGFGDTSSFSSLNVS